MDKTKLPNLQELGDYAGKFYHAIKTSIGEIYDDYKTKHPGNVDMHPEEMHEPDITDNEAGLKKSSIKKNAKKKQ
jgi:hypothetical protein